MDTKQIHLVSQYLAAAGISFVAPQEDDSHTNLLFNEATKSLETREFSKEKDLLSFHFESFSLIWRFAAGQEVFPLEAMKHQDVLKWLNAIAHKRLAKEYTYQFHYDLPYHLDLQDVFSLDDVHTVTELYTLRVLAQHAFENLKELHHLDTEIRVWPHHFDTGGYAKLPEYENVYIGFGLAIPDTVCEDHYFYISGYKDGEIMHTNQFDALSKGQWAEPAFTGAILSANKVNSSQIMQFYKEAISRYGL